MAKNIQQVFTTNPITTNAPTDLMYFGQSPYGPANDAAMTFANFSAQFGSGVTPSPLTRTNDTNVTVTLSGTPNTALLQPVALTMGWSGQLSPSRGGTGINNGTNTITVGGNFQMLGSFLFTGVLTGLTNVTFPTSGTLATTSQIPTGSPLTEVSDTNVTLTLGGSPTTALINPASITVGWSGTLSGVRGGTGVNNGSNTATFAGNLNFADSFNTSGSFPVTQTYTGVTNVTFPTSGTLATTSQLPTPSALSTVNDTNITLTLGGTPATALLQATSVTAGWSGTLSVARGGFGNGTAPSIGQLPVATSSTTYTPKSLLAGTGITIQNNPTDVTFSANGRGDWLEVTGVSAAMSVNTGYTANNLSPVTLGLPTTGIAIGDYVIVQGLGVGGWSIAQSVGQQILYGNLATTLGPTGGLFSTNRADSVTLRSATNGGTTWTVVSSVGTINVI